MHLLGSLTQSKCFYVCLYFYIETIALYMRLLLPLLNFFPILCSFLLILVCFCEFFLAKLFFAFNIFIKFLFIFIFLLFRLTLKLSFLLKWIKFLDYFCLLVRKCWYCIDRLIVLNYHICKKFILKVKQICWSFKNIWLLIVSCFFKKYIGRFLISLILVF